MSTSSTSRFSAHGLLTCGSVIALASQLQELAEAEEEATAQAAPWSAGTTILIVGGVAIVLLAAHLLSRRRSSASPS